MLRRVKIKVVPKAKTGYQVQGSLYNTTSAYGGGDYNADMGAPDTKVKRTISKVPRKNANLEAEGGETVVGNLDGSMMPSFKTIVGPRHSSGGVPLNLPDDSFIFSDTKSMMISDPVILKMFSKPQKKGGYTPADLSKKFDINKYREILQNPDSDKIDIKTAELMIKNCVLKLGALALAQESKKAFPQGIPEIAKPYMEANGIAEEDLLPQQPQQQAPQQNPEMQNQEMGQEMLMEMPNGEPVAMPQEEMLQPGMNQPAPMAAYGMSMGGYDMPDYMAYGGLIKAQDGVEQQSYETKAKTKGNIDYNTPAQTKQSQFQGANYNTVWKPKVETAFSDRKKAEELVNRLETYKGQDADDVKDKLKGKSMDEKISIAKKLATDNKVGPYHYVINDLLTVKEEKVPEEKVPGTQEKGPCQCEDATKTGYQAKVNGVCPCDAKKSSCECTDPDTGETYDPGEDADGNCNECTKEYPGETPEKENPKSWLQDNINIMGAASDLASIKKYMPWEARVDLEEPRPTFLDPTRELAAQSEQANIASQASASFAGPQGLGARNAATQGNAAAQAANTLGNINNQNVNIANQYEANQIGVRNQEQAMNQQMATRRYDKNVIANQNFDNAKRQGRKALRDSYTTAITNRAKTDAMNQMYPNYQVGPRSGGLVNYTPTQKKVSPGVKEMSPEEYAQSISKYDPKIQAKLMELKFGKYGGQFFEHGGYVYSTFPFI